MIKIYIKAKKLVEKMLVSLLYCRYQERLKDIKHEKSQNLEQASPDFMWVLGASPLSDL